MPNPFALRGDRRGAALIEYGLLVGLVAVVAIGSVKSLGDRVNTTFAEVNSELSSNIASSALGDGDKGPGLTDPTGAMATRFSITPEPFRSSENDVGYRPSGDMGTLHFYEGPSEKLNQFEIRRDKGHLSMQLAGNFVTELSGHRVICVDGVDLAFDDASMTYLSGDPGTTLMQWTSVTADTTGWLVEGVRIDCKIST
jgi:pilus assembly protein Flp/PilA